MWFFQDQFVALIICSSIFLSAAILQKKTEVLTTEASQL